MPSKKGYLVPAVIDPLPTRCVTFEVPDDIWWLAAFWGQMTALADTFMWEGTDAQRTEIVQVWNGVLATARANFAAQECQLPLEFRVVGGIVEYRPYPTAGWVAIGEACACDTVIPQPQYNPDTNTAEEMACNVAVGVIEWLMTKYGDTLDQIAAATSTAGAFDAIFLVFPPAYLIADIVLDAIQEVINATVSIARAYDTVERREDFQKWLYCAMIDTGEMTSEIWSDFKQAQLDGEFGGASPGRSALIQYFNSFEEEAIQARSRIESYGSGNCVAFDCGFDWVEIWDFIANQSLQGWVTKGSFPAPTPTASGLQAGTWTDTAPNPDRSYRRIHMGKTTTYADSTTRILVMEIAYASGTTGNSNISPASYLSPRIRLNETANIETAGNPVITLPTGVGSGNFPGTTTILTTYYALAVCNFAERQSNTGQPVTGTGFVTKITIKGNGKNPFQP